jgi:hypothetical protein
MDNHNGYRRVAAFDWVEDLALFCEPHGSRRELA